MMAGPIEELKSAFRLAASELEGKKGSSGLAFTNTLVDTLEDVKEKAGKGHAEIVGEFTNAMQDLQGALEKALADPASLAPGLGGGCLAGCASRYGSRAAAKLGGVRDDVSALLEQSSGVLGKVSPLLEDLKSSMSLTMPIITREVRELMALPGELLQMAERLEGGTKAISEIDLGPVEQSLDVDPINSPLRSLQEIKDRLGVTVGEVKKAVVGLAAFTATAPSRVQRAFDVDIVPCLPMPAPAAVAGLLARLDALKALDLKPLVETLEHIQAAMDGLDVEKVRGPVQAFAADAKEQTRKLTEALELAKSTAQGIEEAQDAVDSFRKGDVQAGLKELGGAAQGAAQAFGKLF
mmetsp:Transcript_60893/g.181435  ORF Transcript_60893/g.181435 Transcript_60893/m.181435 type:complete len:352 (+) Transcript_60893:68-1123(+)